MVDNSTTAPSPLYGCLTGLSAWVQACSLIIIVISATFVYSFCDYEMMYLFCVSFSWFYHNSVAAFFYTHKVHCAIKNALDH